MAEVQIQDIVSDYESEIGRLNGVIIQQRVGHRAELNELRQQLAVVQAQLAGGVIANPEQAPEEAAEASETTDPALAEVKPIRKPRAPRKASAKRVGKP